MAVSESDLLEDLKKAGFRPKKTTFSGNPAWEFAKGVSELDIGDKLKKHGWKAVGHDVPHGGMSGTAHLEKNGTKIKIYAAPLAKTRLFFANSESSMIEKTAGKYPLVEMAAEPIPIEKKPYSWDDFLGIVKSKMFYDPKTFNRMKFQQLPKPTQERIYGKWNARFPSSSEELLKAASVSSVNEIKLALLERAAENAFQNMDIHLANALYDKIGNDPIDDPLNVPVEGPDLDPQTPEDSNVWATDDLDVPEPENSNAWESDHVAKGKYDPKPAEEGKCGPKGCIRKVEGGHHIISNKTGKPWSSPDGTPKVYETREKAENALAAYHATKGFARAPRG